MLVGIQCIDIIVTISAIDCVLVVKRLIFFFFRILKIKISFFLLSLVLETSQYVHSDIDIISFGIEFQFE